jgi:hypothetical protein
VLSLVLVIETTGNGAKDIPWTITDGATEIASGIERGVPANKTIEARAEFRPAAGPGVLHLRGNVDPRNTLHEPGNELGNNVSRVVDKSVNVPGLPAPFPGGSSGSGAGTSSTNTSGGNGSTGNTGSATDNRPGLHPTVSTVKMLSGLLSQFTGSDFLPRGDMGKSTFGVEGSDLFFISSVAGSTGITANLIGTAAHLPNTAGYCSRDGCLITAAAKSDMSCGYHNFSLYSKVPTFFPDSSGGHMGSKSAEVSARLFVTPNVVVESQKMPPDEKGRTLNLTLGPTNHPRWVTSGESISGKIQYVGEVLEPANAADAAFKTQEIELTTSHPNNVKIQTSTSSLRINKVQKAFDFTVKFAHDKTNCLNGPVEITARMKGGPDNGDKAVTRLFIIPK